MKKTFRIADQSNNRQRGTLPGAAVQAASPAHLLKLLPQSRDAVAHQTPIGFDLGFTGAAQKAETAALPAKMGPGADQAAALILQMRKFHLQRAFPGSRPLAKYVQDQAGAVHHLAIPALLEIALLHRAERCIDNRHLHVIFADLISNVRNLTFTQQGGRRRCPHMHDAGVHDRKTDGFGKADCLRQTGLLAALSIAGSPHRQDHGSPNGLAQRRLGGVLLQVI
jgi:hypothetical protein